MQESKLQKWGKKREVGKWKYVLTYGVLFWGTLCGVTATILMSLVNNNFDFSAIPADFASVKFLATLATFMLAGIAFGLMLWNTNEKLYRNYTSAEN